MRLISLVLALLVVGCAESSNVRDSQPVLADAFRGDYRTLALCALDGLQRDGRTPTMLINESTGRAAIYKVTEPIGVITSWDWELTLTQAQTDQTQAELRVRWSVWGRAGWHLGDVIWDSLRNCRA